MKTLTIPALRIEGGRARTARTTIAVSLVLVTALFVGYVWLGNQEVLSSPIEQAARKVKGFIDSFRGD